MGRSPIEPHPESRSETANGVKGDRDGRKGVFPECHLGKIFWCSSNPAYGVGSPPAQGEGTPIYIFIARGEREGDEGSVFDPRFFRGRQSVSRASIYSVFEIQRGGGHGQPLSQDPEGEFSILQCSFPIRYRFSSEKRFNQPRLGLLRRKAKRIIYDF